MTVFPYLELCWRDIATVRMIVKVLLLAGILLLIVVIGFWFFLKFPAQEWLSLQKQNMNLQQKGVQAQTTLRSLAVYQRQLHSIKYSILDFFQPQGYPESMDNIIENIINHGTTGGIEFISIKTSKATKLDFYRTSLVKFVMLGNYSQLTECIKTIFQLPHRLSIGDFSLLLNKSAVHRQWDKRQLLILSMDMKIYSVK